MNLPTPYYDRDGISIYCADCRVILPMLATKSIGLVLTDPPYGIDVGNDNRRHKFARSDWDLRPMAGLDIGELFRVSEEQIIWGGNYFDLPPTQCFYVWDKWQPQDFTAAMCEMAWVSRQGAAKMFRLPAQEQKGKQHPAQKPVALLEWCLSLFPNAMSILDPFLGSGTTAVAAKKLGRKCIGIEIEERYCEIAVKRLAQSVMPLEVA